MVVSVGPYRLTSCAGPEIFRRHLPINASVSGSPDMNNQRRNSRSTCPSDSGSQDCMTVGVVCTTVMLSRFIHSMVSKQSPSVGRHSRAPLVKGKKTSRSKTSNVRPISCETRSSVLIAKVLRCHFRK